MEEVVPVKRIVAAGSKRSASSSSNQLTLVSKYAKKMKYVDIASHYEQTLFVTGQCKDADDAFGKGFCISMVHTGVNKNLSNTAILENYNTAIEGMKEYYKFQCELIPGKFL